MNVAATATLLLSLSAFYLRLALLRSSTTARHDISCWQRTPVRATGLMQSSARCVPGEQKEDDGGGELLGRRRRKRRAGVA